MTPHQLAVLAAELTKEGLFVFPVASNKHPCTKHGLKDAVDRPALAYRLFMDHPSAYHIGVPMGTDTMLIAIDVDPLGKEWLAAHWDRLGDTLIHRTPRGGVHIIYKMPLPPAPVITSRQTCDGTPLLAPGVDVQGEGRSLIWAGSPGYTIINWSPIQNVPKWLLHRLTRQPRKAPPVRYVEGMNPSIAKFDAVLNRVQFSRQGERNQLVFWGGCRGGELVAEGLLSEHEATRLVAARGMAAGLPEIEAWRSARSGVQTTARQSRVSR